MSVFDAFTNSAKLSELCERLRNGCKTIGSLAIKTSSDPDAKTTAAVVFEIAGKLYSLGAQGTLDLSALCAGTIANGATKGVFLFVNAAGTVTGQLVAADSSGNIACPDHATSLVCFGSIKIANASGSAFTVGTTALDTSNVTVTYKNHGCLLPGDTI